jgi:hypothetical protein
VKGVSAGQVKRMGVHPGKQATAVYCRRTVVQWL